MVGDLDELPRAAFRTALADPPWQFDNRTGKGAPEHRRLNQYDTMSMQEIAALPVRELMVPPAHLYLWVPNAMLPEGLAMMKTWGFRYVTCLVWYKVRKDGGPDRRGMGFYFRNVTELILFGVWGTKAKTLAPARSQENIVVTRKREHSRKPDELYSIIEACSPAPWVELFATSETPRPGWTYHGKPHRKPNNEEGQHGRLV